MGDRVTRLPPRRKPQKSGIERGPQRVWLRHRAWLRSHHCVVPGCLAEPIEVSHLRTAANAGVALKPHDGFAVPMCHAHHAEYHQRGHKEFQRQYGVDLAALAVAFVKDSRDHAMRESLALAEETADAR